MAQKTRDHEPPPGEIIFHTGDIAYELILDMGQNGRGERLLLARPRDRGGAGAQVVVRVLNRFADRKQHQRLQEEMRLALRLSHPNIARVYGLHEEKGNLYALQEHVHGGRSLDDIYQDALFCGRWCSESFVLYVAAQVASALHHAHTRTDEAGQPLGIVHRDIHPQSVLLRPQGEVTLTDFGLSTASRFITTLPRKRGHVVYASPEQLLGRPVNARSDLFALGLVMLEMLTGHHLFWLMEDVDVRQLVRDMLELPSQDLQTMEAVIEQLGQLQGAALTGIDRAQLAARARSFAFEDVERVAREVPEPTRFILHKLLRHDPAERFASAADLEAALRERLEAVGPYGAKEAEQEVFFLRCAGAGVPLKDIPSLYPEDSTKPVTERDEDRITTAPGSR
jgi:serine/threonine-protein kinase